MTILMDHELMEFVEGKVDLKDPLSEQQDQLILSWLLCSMSEEILKQIVRLTTSHEFWTAVQGMLVLLSRLLILHLCGHLLSLKKRGLGMKEYILQIVDISDLLTIVGDLFDDVELGLMALCRLGKEYEAFVI